MLMGNGRATLGNSLKERLPSRDGASSEVQLSAAVYCLPATTTTKTNCAIRSTINPNNDGLLATTGYRGAGSEAPSH